MDRIPESTVYQTVTVDSFKLYPRVPTLVENQTPEYQNERSTRHQSTRMNGVPDMKEIEKLWKELKTVKKIERMKTMLEQNKEINMETQYIESLNKILLAEIMPISLALIA